MGWLRITCLLTYCDIHENFWTLQVVVEVEVTITLDAALRELHAELSAIGQAGDGETEWLGEVVTAWLKKCSCLVKKKIHKSFTLMLPHINESYNSLIPAKAFCNY